MLMLSIHRVAGARATIVATTTATTMTATRAAVVAACRRFSSSSNSSTTQQQQLRHRQRWLASSPVPVAAAATTVTTSFSSSSRAAAASARKTITPWSCHSMAMSSLTSSSASFSTAAATSSDDQAAAQRVQSDNFKVSTDDLASLKNFLHQRKVFKVREELDRLRLDRHSITRLHFSRLAAHHGLSPQESDHLLHALNDAGLVLLFADHDDDMAAYRGADADAAPSEEVVYLNPRHALNLLMNTIDPAAHLLGERKEQLAVLQAEEAEMTQLYREVDDAANKSGRFKMWMVVAAMSTQVTTFAYLTWWQLSWDLMEPITYFFGSTTALIGLMIVSWRKQEHNYEGWFNHARSTAFDKLAAQRALDVTRLASVRAEIARLESDIARK